MTSDSVNHYVRKLDAFTSPPAVFKGFVMIAAREHSTSVFYIAGKASADSFGPFNGDYVPINGGIEWMPLDKTKEFPHGMASWVLPLGLYHVFLVPSKEEMFETKQELFLAVDEKGVLTKLSRSNVDDILNSGTPLPVPPGLFPAP